MRLDFQNALGFPLLPKSLSFFRFAYRAISLPTIRSIVFMPLLAIFFLGINVAARRAVALGILGRRYAKQVLRIHAGPISASVIHNISVGDRSIHEIESNTMRLSICSPKRKNPVAITIFLSGPQHAIIDFFPFGIESFNLFGCCVAHIKNLSLVEMALKAFIVRGLQ